MTKTGLPKLWIVVPCYNEEDVIQMTAPMFFEELNLLIEKEKISAESKILLVDDGSTDSTWSIIKSLSSRKSTFIGIRQSKNMGHQSALLAGLMEVKDHADLTITIDCDAQDDISVMEEMVEKYIQGYDIVYGVRNKRKTDSTFKRLTAQMYYKTMKVLGADIVYNHADYRLVSSRVLKELSHFEEVNLFLRGLIPLIGFESTRVYYDRKQRLAGKTHYSIGKMIALALDGVTSFSIRPLRLISSFGIFVILLSLIGIIWAVIRSLTNHTVPGWTSMTCIICFLSGFQILFLGVIGEYVGKTYIETKKRPRYIISERTWE